MKQDSLSKKRKPLELGPTWSILLLPLLGLAVVLSIPYSKWQRRRSRREEQLFEDAMRSCGRTVQWHALEVNRKEESGCIVVEWLSFKGPSRWWWVKDDLLASGRLRALRKDGAADLYVPLDQSEWSDVYTGLNGKAMLIIATREEKHSLVSSGFCFKEGVNALLVAPFLAKSDQIGVTGCPTSRRDVECK